MAAGELLLPVAAVLKRDLLEGGYIQADETPIGVQSQQTKGRNHQAYEFQYSRPGGPVVFDFCMSRAREGPAEFLARLRGHPPMRRLPGLRKDRRSRDGARRMPCPCAQKI